MPSRATRTSSASCSTATWRAATERHPPRRRRDPGTPSTLERVSRNARIFAIVGTLVVLVVAFVVLPPGDAPDKTTTTNPVAAPPRAATAPPSPPASPAGEPAPPAPTFTKVTVRGGKPVGGIKKITVSKGDRV